jgi:hypothetical protein
MKAQELRIGNLVNYDTAEGDVLPNVIDWQDLKWLSEDEQGFNLVHNPIPLTEEWLLRFGFKHLGNGKFSGGFKNMFKISSHQFGIDFYYGGIDPYYIKPHYVHNLQNLFFALTNKELTLTK